MKNTINELTTITYNTPGIDIKADLMGEIGRVLSAAVINRNFREALLADPKQSIEAGYFGESFHLPKHLVSRISDIKSSTIEHFSSEIVKLVDALSIPDMAEVFVC